ncbi:hypothetical protein EDB80DRAFT_205067 [Ilyonectria destructans]|nr:hypothetical protein EDB80DRAFT_205067 [Ilyonectria destructans]
MLHDLFLNFLMTENEGAVLVDPGECLDVPAKDAAHVASSLAASILRKVSFEALPSRCPPSLRLACPSQSLTSDSVVCSETQSEATGEEPSSEAVVSSSESSQVQLQQDNNPFRSQAELPHVSPKIFVYPNSASEISDAFQSRFRQVINLFRLNTEQHPRLKPHLEHIDYGLRMCGPSIDEAHPSILVFCRPSEFDYLRSLLNSKHLKIQYCLRKSSPKYSWKSWGKKPSQVPADSYKPLFNLYFWRAPRPRNLYCMNAVSVAINTTEHETPPLTTAGTAITVLDEQGLLSTSTMGCILQVDSHFYGLTAAHILRCAKVAPNNQVGNTPHEPWSNPAAFQCQTDPLYDGSSMASDEEAFASEDTPQSSFYDSVADDMPDDDDFVEDVEYASLPDDDQAQERWQDSGVSLATPVANLSPDVLDQEQLHRIALLPSSNCSATSGVPDNDWALVALDAKDQPLPNAFFDTNTMSQPIFFSAVARSLPEEETPILIVPSRRGVLKGILQPIPYILGGITRNEQAEYWSVIVPAEEGKFTWTAGH